MADIPIPRELVERNIAFITMIRANLGFPAMTPGQTIYPLRMQVSMDLVGDMIAMSEALRSALTQQAEGATQDEIIELVAALEIRAILEHIKTVAAIYPVDDMPTPFQSAWRGCCEEIFFLATGCQWHMSQDDGRRRVQGDTAGQKIVERALATSATPPSPSAEVTAELMRLYATDSVDKLVEAQEQYIQNLQVKLHAAKAAQPSGEVLTEPIRKPLTNAQMEAGREAIFSTGNPFCPCDSKTFRKVVDWTERQHGIGIESATLAKIGAKP